MKKIKSYESALEELQQIVEELQMQEVNVDQLADKIKRAGVLVEYCKTRLRDVEADVDKLLNRK